MCIKTPFLSQEHLGEVFYNQDVPPCIRKSVLRFSLRSSMQIFCVFNLKGLQSKRSWSYHDFDSENCFYSSRIGARIECVRIKMNRVHFLEF